MKFIYWLLRTLHLRDKAVVTVKDGIIKIDKLDPGEEVRIPIDIVKKTLRKKK